MYHVKALPEAPLAGLDMEIADEDEFSPDKLRSTLERLYMTVIIGVIGFGKHIVRLRSWREPRRTSGFCAVRSVYSATAFHTDFNRSISSPGSSTCLFRLY